MLTIRRLLFYLLWILLFTAWYPADSISAADRPQSIKVVMDNNYPPYVFQDNAGKLQGILIDQWRLWEQKSGIAVEIHAMDWDKAISGMKDDKFDVIDTIFKTKERSSWLDFTPPYARLEVPIFFHKDISGITDAASLKGFPVAAKTGDDAVDLLKRNAVENLILFNSYEAIIVAAKEHKVAVFVVDAPPALYFLHKFGIRDHYKQSAPLNVGEFHRAVKKGNSALLKVVEDVFGQIPPDDLKKIETRWYGASLYNGRLPRYILIITGSFALLIFILFTWNRILRKTVNTRTAELKTRVTELQTLSLRQDAILAAVPDIIMELDKDNVYAWANRAGLEFFGEDVVGKEAASYLEGTQNTADTFPPLFKNTETATYIENWQRRKDGEIRLLAWWRRKLRDAQGNASGSISTARDITESKRAEEAQRETQEELTEIFSMSLDLICIADINTATFRKVNPAFNRILGYSEQELLTHSFLEFTHPDDVAPTVATINERLKKGEAIVDFTNRYRCKDGNYRWLEWVSHPIPERGVTFAIAHDITERKKSEELINQSERRFRTNFVSAPVGMAIIDTQRRFLEVNTQICKILGYNAEELLGRSFNFFTHPDDREGGRERWRQLLAGEVKFNRAEKRYIHKDGRVLWAIVSNALIRDDNGAPLHILSHLVDITDQKTTEAEKKKLESQLHQSQKMEAIGTLAGGIAHDFNNLLMGIQGRVSLISLDMETFHPHWEHINAIDEYIRSATHLTKQLLGFARGGRYEVKPIDINELLLNSSAMFGRTKKEIQIHTKLHESALVVEADRGQIEQVFLNMYVNAWQAMPSDGGELYLATKIVTLDEAYCKAHQADPGRYVRVSITDTGTGMDEATRLRIFDPFFTTKEKNRGTGMGLASAYGIIKNHGGMITVYSEIGHGTTFNIYLPASDKEVPREISMEAVLIKGSGTILLVDDEEMITAVGQAMLEWLGYRVIVSRGGQEAVDVVTDLGTEIDLVILDLIMPEMDGGKTFDRLREIRPQMPVLLSSGYAINGQANKIMARGCNGFIQKPYNISELSNKVSHVLNERRS